jgi:hypothetical protein
MLYALQIENALGIHESGKSRVKFEIFDCGAKIGVCVTWPDGNRHAVLAEFADTWAANVIAALKEWRELHDAKVSA